MPLFRQEAEEHGVLAFPKLKISLPQVPLAPEAELLDQVERGRIAGVYVGFEAVEAEIFERILAATRHCTTILISHRFSTVRHVDRICVLEKGKVVEFGTHAELMALNGRYRTMFDLQAQRFTAEDEEGKSYDVLA